MSPNDRPKKLFKVASEYNVSTQSIVDALAEEGFDVANKPNSKITPEMYEVLEETLFTSFDRRQLLGTAREIEDRAWRVGVGTLRVGFQRPGAFERAGDQFFRLVV